MNIGYELKSCFHDCIFSSTSMFIYLFICSNCSNRAVPPANSKSSLKQEEIPSLQQSVMIEFTNMDKFQIKTIFGQLLQTTERRCCRKYKVNYSILLLNQTCKREERKWFGMTKLNNTFKKVLQFAIFYNTGPFNINNHPISPRLKI